MLSMMMIRVVMVCVFVLELCILVRSLELICGLSD